MRAGDGRPVADTGAVAEAVVHWLEQHEPIDPDRPRRSIWFRRARGRGRGVDPRPRPGGHDARYRTWA